nr:hypothetical protein GCM10025732_09270 [Glycomyces mayteni]
MTGSVLVVDFRDSFVHTIVSYLRALGARVDVRRSDRTDVDEAVRLRPAGVLLSPGPAAPTRPASATTSSTGSPGTSRSSACAWGTR